MSGFGRGFKASVDANGELTISVHASDLFEAMTPEAKREFADSVSTECEVIEAVAAQIANGETDMHSRGYQSYPALIGDRASALDRARRTVAAASSEVAAEEIASLTRGIALRDEEIAALRLDMMLLDDWYGPPDTMYGMRRTLHDLLVRLREKRAAVKP